MTGATLGHYELLEKIGEGGMGVVYKARDTRLGRLVAIKLLTAEGNIAADRRQRFVQEAKAASALEHPHIVTIHEIGEADGVDYIVMEYLGGRTLEGTLGGKGMPPGDALRIASELADALARAHAAGIVHRDLKPSNVMFTEDGRAKIVDFGLAKLSPGIGAASDRSADSAEALTVTSAPETAHGVVMGTAGYMSPEQAQGAPIDARTDIFSFGVLLFEMLTGRRAFRRDSGAASLAAVLRDELPAPSSIAPDVPPEVDRIVATCARKDPSRRIQHMADVKVMLDEASAALASSASRPPAPAFRRRHPLQLLAAGLVALLLLAAGGYGLFRLREARPAPRERQLATTRFTFDTGLTVSPALSPDGKVAAYASDRAGNGDLDIYVQQVAGRQAIRITDHPAQDLQPAFSPDGTKIAFRSERDGGGIYVVDAFGGTPRRLTVRGHHPRWSPDGTTISFIDVSPHRYWGRSGIFLVPAAGGPPQPFAPGYASAEPPFAMGAVWSPRGKELLFKGWKLGEAAPSDWWVAPVDGGEPAALAAGRLIDRAVGPFFPCQWTDDGVVYLTGTTMEGTDLYLVPLSAETKTLTLRPERIVTTSQMAYDPVLSNDGRLLFQVLEWTPGFLVADLAGAEGKITGTPRTVATEAATKGGVSLSRDGRRIAYYIVLSGRDRRVEIRVQDLASGQETVAAPAVRVLSSETRFTPDGTAVAYRDRLSEGGWGALLAASDGSGVREFCRDCVVADFFADGESACVFVPPSRLIRRGVNGGNDEVLFELADPRERDQGDIGEAAVSWDDRFLALEIGRADGRAEIRIVRVDGTPKTERDGVVVATDSRLLASPHWSPDGDLLYYLSQRDGNVCAWAQHLDPLTKEPRGEPFAVLHLHDTRSGASILPRAWLRLEVGRNRLVIPTATSRGNLWTARLDQAAAKVP